MANFDIQKLFINVFLSTDNLPISVTVISNNIVQGTHSLKTISSLNVIKDDIKTIFACANSKKLAITLQFKKHDKDNF